MCAGVGVKGEDRRELVTTSLFAFCHVARLLNVPFGREGDTTPDPDLQRYRQLAENPEEIWMYYADTPPVVAN